MKRTAHFNLINREEDAVNYQILSKEERNFLTMLGRRIYSACSYHLMKRRQFQIFGASENKTLKEIQKTLNELNTLLNILKGPQSGSLSLNYKLRSTSEKYLNTRVESLLEKAKRSRGRLSILEEAGDVPFVLLSAIERSKSRRLTDSIGTMLRSLKTQLDESFGAGSFDSFNFPEIRTYNPEDYWERSAKESLKKSAWNYVFNGRVNTLNGGSSAAYFSKFLDRGGYTEYEVEIDREMAYS